MLSCVQREVDENRLKPSSGRRYSKTWHPDILYLSENRWLAACKRSHFTQAKIFLAMTLEPESILVYCLRFYSLILLDLQSPSSTLLFFICKCKKNYTWRKRISLYFITVNYISAQPGGRAPARTIYCRASLFHAGPKGFKSSGRLLGFSGNYRNVGANGHGSTP